MKLRIAQLILLLLISLVFGCKTQPTSSVNLTKSKVPNKDKNNSVVVKNNNSEFTGDGATEIIFEGENNLIEIGSNNSNVHSSDTSVIIIKGNNNNISIAQENLIDTLDRSNKLPNKSSNTKSKRDTTIIQLNNSEVNFYESHYDGFSVQKSSKINYSNPDFETQFKEIGIFLEEDNLMFINENSYFVKDVNKQLEASKALKYYINKAKIKNWVAFYEIGIILIDVSGIDLYAQTIIDFFEVAAYNNVVAAQLKLGNIYENGLFLISPDYSKAIHYYTMALKNGNKEASTHIQRLKEE